MNFPDNRLMYMGLRTFRAFVGSLVEAFRLAVDSIRSTPLRSSLTVVGVVIGVATVALVGGLLEGVQKFILVQVGDLAPNVIRIEKAAFQDFKGDGQEFAVAQAKRPDLLPDDLDELVRQSPPDLDLAGQATAALTVKARGKSLEGISIQGITPNAFPLVSVRVAVGREFNATDDRFRKPVCVVGMDVVTNLFDGRDPVGREVTLGNVPFSIIGVAEPKGAQFGTSQDGFVLIPLRTFTKLLGERSRSMVFLASPKSGTDLTVDEAVEVVRAGLRRRHGLKPGVGDDDFSITTAKSAQAFGNTVKGVVGAAIFPLTAIALVVGGVVVMNMMLASVTERTREVGIRKALGATRTDILIQFLMEATLLTGIGGTFGTLAAWGIAALAGKFTGFPVVIPVWAFSLAFFSAVAVGLTFGVLPARRAAALDPVLAISRE